MPTKRQVRRKRTARQLAQPRQPVTEVEVPRQALEPEHAIRGARSREALERAARRADAITLQRLFPLVALAVVYFVVAGICALVARKQLIPNLLPDEMFYGKLAQGLAFGDGRQWRGSNYGLPPLWPSLLSLTWGGSVPHGYAVAKTLGAFVASTTVLPVWLLARRYMSPRRALAPAVFAVAGVWMQVTDFLASENLAYPLATASLAMTVIAVEDTRARWLGWSLFFAVLATLTRTQMLVLPLILVVALFIDLIRQPRGLRRARMAQRPRVLWICLVAGVAAILLAFIIKPGLTNYDLLANHTSIGRFISTTFHEGVDSLALFAFVPVVAVIALMARPANWRDERFGALLVTIAAAVICVYPVLGRFLAWATNGVPVDRYTMYLAPLLLVAMFAAPGRIGRRSALAAAVAITGLMAAQPTVDNFVEQGGIYGIQKALFDNGVSQDHFKLGVTLVALVVAVAGAFALTARTRARAGLAAAGAICAVVMLGQNWAARSYEHSFAAANRNGILPAELDWVDRHATGTVATMDIGKSVPLRANSVIYTEFFNKSIKSYYSTIATGNACDIDIAKTGLVRHGDTNCTAWPQNWVLADGPVKMTLRGQKVLADTARSGTLVSVPPGDPQIQSLVGPPCTVYGCTGQFEMALYLDEPSDVTVKFGPGSADHQIQVGGSRVRTLPAGQPATIHLKMGAGPQSGNIPVDWSEASDAPPLESVEVTTPTRTFRAF